jgi:hypothetical protein
MPGHAQLSTKNTNLDMDINCKSRPLRSARGKDPDVAKSTSCILHKELALLRKILRDSYCRRVGEVAEHIAIASLLPGSGDRRWSAEPRPASTCMKPVLCPSFASRVTEGPDIGLNRPVHPNAQSGDRGQPSLRRSDLQPSDYPGRSRKLP